MNIPEKCLIDISTKTHPNIYAKVSPEDYERVAKHKWWICFYSKQSGKYSFIRASVNGGNVMMARFILGLNADRKHRVVHINGDPTDNRRENLLVQGKCCKELPEPKPERAPVIMRVMSEREKKAEGHNMIRIYEILLSDPVRIAKISDPDDTEDVINARIKELTAIHGAPA